MDEDIRTKVLNEFGIKSKPKYIEVPGGFNNNYDIFVSEGRFFLKRKPESRVSNTLTDCEVSQYLFEKGVETGKPLKSAEGVFEVRDGGYVYSMFNYKDGENYNFSDENITKAGESLAMFHANMIDYARKISFGEDTLTWSKEMLEELEIEGWKEKLSNAEIEFAKHLSRMLKTPIHWDFHGGNIKIIGGKIVPFDFEFVHYGYRVLDIANSSICLTAISPPDYGDAESFIQKCELDFRENRLFLAGYENITSLNDEELQVFPEALDVAWIGWTAYTLKNKKCSAETVKNAKHFPDWIEANRERIREECRKR